MKPTRRASIFIVTLCLAAVSARLSAGETPTLDSVKATLKENPKDEDALYGGGMLSYLAGDFKGAVDYWQRLKELEPEDWKLRSKLIQAYSAAGETKKREAEIASLREARSSGKYPDLAEETFFIRDQIVVGDTRAFALEYYELSGDHALVWKFILQKGDDDVPFHLSLGSYDMDTEMARERGEIGKDERIYHLDYYSNDGGHRTYDFYKKKPAYDEIKEQVIKILKDEKKPLSETIPGKGK